jgi:hypothetical protein
MLVYSGISRSGMSKRCQRQRERNEISEMTPRYLTGQDVGLAVVSAALVGRKSASTSEIPTKNLR